jgi:N6-adenosine-specific RNA methylase IME4
VSQELIVSPSADPVLIRLDRAHALLSEARDSADCKRVADIAAAMERYARSQKLGKEAVQYATGIKVEALTRLGEFEEKEPKNTGAKGIGPIAVPNGNYNQPPTQEQRLGKGGRKVAMLGQALVTMQREDEALYHNIWLGKVKVAAGCRQFLAAKNGTGPKAPPNVSDLQDLIRDGCRFGCIYADPPWRYGNQGTRAATDNHYETMTVEEIAKLPVGALAADCCHLHLWTTNAFLFECPRLFEAWGFRYQGVFVWCKPQMGIGNCWRVGHELLLLAIRGEPRRFKCHDLMSWLEADRDRHSSKPERVRLMLEKASPGPYLEMFGRRAPPGWTVWGNEIDRDLFASSLPKVTTHVQTS